MAALITKLSKPGKIVVGNFGGGNISRVTDYYMSPFPASLGVTCVGPAGLRQTIIKDDGYLGWSINGWAIRVLITSI